MEFRHTFSFCALLTITLSTPLLRGQAGTQEILDPKIEKVFHQGVDFEKQGMFLPALESFKKADKIEAGRCFRCQQQIITLGLRLRNWKDAEFAASEEVIEAGDAKSLAEAHYLFGVALLSEANEKKKVDIYQLAHKEMAQAIAAYPSFPDAVYDDAVCLARVKQDEQAKAQFERFLQIAPVTDARYPRARRLSQKPEFVRENMAPQFAVTLADGRQISSDDLLGKVVLVDFWATWCPACQEAIPHMRKIAAEFNGEPFVLLSVSDDENEEKWRSFIAKHEMTWENCNDAFDNNLGRAFGVVAIPTTFMIDADGLIQNIGEGDTALEGKLKKLVARAKEEYGHGGGPQPPSAAQSGQVQP